MILIEAGRPGDRGFDAKMIFAAQLADRGHAVIIDEETVPERFERSQKYEVAPFLAPVSEHDVTTLLVIGAEDLADATLARLRSVPLADGARIVAIGRFPDLQSEIGARARLAYALGREPETVGLSAHFGSDLPVTAISPLAAPEMPAAAPADVPEVFVFLPPEMLEEPHVLPVLAALDNVPAFRIQVVTPGAGKDVVKRSRYSRLGVYGYSELGPSILARRADIAVFYGETVPGERMAAFAVELMAAGRVVVDCTTSAGFQVSGAPVLRGAEDLGALQNLLEFTVIGNAGEIGRAARESRWIAARGIARLEDAIGLPRRAPDPAVTPGPARALFLPTNGNGLGHAQRCSLIAAEFQAPEAAAFAAFPSCVPLVRGRGFPCLPLVQKSPDHPEDYANDIVNYLRLRRTLSASDHLVFDGGYVFESIFRTIHETGCSATWIRRGLWRPGQISEAQIERERLFRQVIVPSEAFDELNADYSGGANVRRVGPVVQNAPQEARAAVRDRLAQTLDVAFDTLAVSMLGGGVAADRTAQLQRLCASFDARQGCLHLVVVWPNARVAPGFFGWRNTRVVRTLNSLALAKAADFVVSAVGYNSFHEIMYHQIPAVFVPQVAPYMDDQERRARAASERDLAITVLAHELLGLERAVSEMIDGRGEELRARLASHELPEPGNRAAARMIEKELAA